MESLKELNIPLHEVIETVITVLNVRDPYTFEHSWRVAAISELLAGEFKLSENEVDLIHVAAHLHDIGKVGIPDVILRKEGELTDGEYEVMKTHPAIGADIVKKIPRLEEIARLIRSHHERFDGRGYPDGLANRAIPLGARIIAMADTYDALTSDRPYRKGGSHADALEIIRENRGAQFCPDTVDTFLAIEKTVLEMLFQVKVELESFQRSWNI